MKIRKRTESFCTKKVRTAVEASKTFKNQVQSLTKVKRKSVMKIEGKREEEREEERKILGRELKVLEEIEIETAVEAS